MYSWGILFLVSTYEIRRLQAIDLSLNEQSHLLNGNCLNMSMTRIGLDRAFVALNLWIKPIMMELLDCIQSPAPYTRYHDIWS
jgi:hypothetical protein